MNVGDVKTRVRRQFGDESGVQITDGDLLRWINDGQRDICNQNEGILETIGTANLVADQIEYSLPTDLLVLRSISVKGSSDLSYASLKGMSLQDFDQFVDGWDGTFYGNGLPSVYCVFANTIKLFPRPRESVTSGLKIYYQRFPVDRVLDADVIDLPLAYHNAIVSYCLGQAYELDEDWDSAGNKFQQMTADVTGAKDREKLTHSDYYPTITTLPEDSDTVSGWWTP